MKIIIIRHAEPDYSIDSLTEKGWREAELLSNRVIKMPIDDFYCSPLGRAKDTAKPTLEKLNKKAEILDWLHEFRGKIKSPFTGIDRLAWDLPPYLWCKEERFYDINRWYEPEIIANGNFKEIYDATTEGVDNLLLRYGLKREGRLYRGGEDKTIALFCHFAMGITILSYLTGFSPIVAQNNFFMAPSSVTTLVTQKDTQDNLQFRAVSIGDISHLYEAGEPMSESGLYPDFEV